MKVLIVDDNADLRHTLRMMVDLVGYETLGAATASAALQELEAERPSIILLDIGLPDMDGYDLCRAMRATEPGKRAIIAAQTGRDAFEDREKASAAGFDRFLVKPVSFEALEAFLREAASSSPETRSAPQDAN